MPRANRVCSFPGCLKRPSGTGRCSGHPFLRYDEAWKRNVDYGERVPDALKRTVLHSSNYTCALCALPASDVDHIIPKFKGGGNNLENLQPLCSSCHARKSSTEGHEALRMKRAGIDPKI